MPVRAVCPECGATTSIDDPTVAATLTCHQCGGTVSVPTAKVGPPRVPRPGPPPLPVSAAPAAAGSAFEVLDDSADSAVAVAEPPGPPRPRKPAPAPDEEEYEVLQDIGDDEPAADAGFEAVEDDEDDEVEMDVGVPRVRAFVGDFEPGSRPLPRRKGVKSSGSPLLIVGGVLAALLLVAGGAAGVYFLWPDKDDGTPVVVEGNPPGPENPAPPVVGPATPVDTLRLPGKATTVAVDSAAGDALTLVVHCAGEKKLLVFALENRRLAFEADTSGPDALFAINRRTLYVLDPPTRMIRRWDLQLRRPMESVPFPFPGKPKAFAVGSLGDGPALVLTDEPGAGWPVHFLDLNSFGPFAYSWAKDLPKDLPREVTVRAAADGSGWVVVPSGKAASQSLFIRAEGRKFVWTAPPKAAVAYAIPSPNGMTVHTPAGSAGWGNWPFGTADQKFTRTPVADTPLEMTVRRDGDRAKVAVFPHAKDVPVFADLDIPAAVASLPPDESVFYSTRGQILVVPESQPNQVEVFNAPNLHTALQGYPKPLVTFLSTPARTAYAGGTYKYSVRTATSGPGRVVCSFDKGVDGVKVDEIGNVTWNMPAIAPANEQYWFHLKAALPDGTASTQDVYVYNAGAAPPAAPKVVIPKKQAPESKPKGPPMKSPDPMPPVVVDPIAPGAKLVNRIPSRAGMTPTPIPDGSLSVSLDGPVRDVCVGGHGRYLIAHLPTARRLVIFDVSAAKVVGAIGLNADNVLFAAGMSRVLVVYPEEKQILRYTLPDGKMDKDAELDLRPKPVAAAMGSSTTGPLILGGPVTQNNASKLALTFIDVETLKEVRVDKADGDLRVGFGAAAHLRVAADGGLVTTWYRQLQPSGLQLVRPAGNTLTGVHKSIAVGHVIPAPYGGAQVFTEKGIYDAKGEPVAQRDVACLPATHGKDYLTIRDTPAGGKVVSVWRGGEQPAVEFTTLPGFDGKKDPFERDNPTLALDKRLFLVPEANVLVAVPPAANRFVLYPLTPAKK